MVLHLILYHVLRAAFLLLGDIAFQFGRGERLLLVGSEHQVHRLHHNHRINLRARLNLLAQSLQRTNLVVQGLPMVSGIGDGVILTHIGRHMTHQFLVLEMVERETIAAAGGVVVLLQIGNHIGGHLQLHITG